VVRGRPERVAERERVRGLIRGRYGSAGEGMEEPILISTIEKEEKRIYRYWRVDSRTLSWALGL
jgi:hypothetical protein